MAKDIKGDGSYDKRKSPGRRAKGLSDKPKALAKKMNKGLKNTKGPGKLIK